MLNVGCYLFVVDFCLFFICFLLFEFVAAFSATVPECISPLLRCLAVLRDLFFCACATYFFCACARCCIYYG